MEANPHHPTTRLLHGQWHKIVAILMHKLKTHHEIISIEDIQALPENHFIVAQELSNGIHLTLVDEIEAKRLAKQDGQNLNLKG